MILLKRQDAAIIDEYIFNRIGIPRSVVVERAGIAVARRVISIRNDGSHSGWDADVFAGKGMNGADAMVCARELLSSGIHVRLWEVFPEEGRLDDLSWIRDVCIKMGISIVPACRYHAGARSFIIDGIFGTSFDIFRRPNESTLDVFREIRKAQNLGSIIIAVDIPSGVDCDTAEVSDYAFNADETVTFIACKAGIAGYPGRNQAGNITIERLGMPPGLEELAEAAQDLNAITMRDAASLVPARKADGHKGTFGRVGILGGSKGMAGAVCLCAISCMRAGAGLVYLIVPEDIAGMCLMKVPEALVFTSYDDLPVHPDVLIAGPGGSKDDDMEQQIFKAMATQTLLVLDAQALNIIASDSSRAKTILASRHKDGLPQPIITPHPGEMDRLMPSSAGKSRTQNAVDAAKEYNCVAVLKGAGTVVALPDGRAWINTTGNSSMAKGGSGDVLAGLIGAMLAQGLAPVDAAVFGVYFHGLCGDLSCGDSGEYSAVPSDIISKYSEGFQILRDCTAGRWGPSVGSPDNPDCSGAASELFLERKDG